MEGVILMGAPVSCRPGPVWLKGLRSCPNPRTAGGSLATRGHYFSQFRSGNECLDPSREPVVGFWVGSSCSLSECSRTFQSRAKLACVCVRVRVGHGCRFSGSLALAMSSL